MQTDQIASISISTPEELAEFISTLARLFDLSELNISGLCSVARNTDGTYSFNLRARYHRLTESPSSLFLGVTLDAKHLTLCEQELFGKEITPLGPSSDSISSSLES